MTLQVVASPTIIILTTLEVSVMLLANIYSRGINHEDRHVKITIYLQYRSLVSPYISEVRGGDKKTSIRGYFSDACNKLWVLL